MATDYVGGPKGITEEGVPKARFDDPKQAQEAVQNLIEANKERHRKTAQIQGMFDGNPPYNPSKLRQSGQAYRSNFNTLQAKGMLSAALVPYYDLFSSSPFVFEVQLDVDDPDDRVEWSGIATEEFDAMLKSWRNFDYRVQAMLKDYVGFNKGFFFWDDPYDWRMAHIAHHRLLVPDGTSIDLDDLEWFVIRQNRKVHQLWNEIKDNDLARSAGWKIENVRTSIINATPEGNEDVNQWHKIQKELLEHDLLVSQSCRVIKVAHVFVREFDGKWSHLIVDEESLNPGFLYKSISEIDRITHIIAPFFFEVLDSMWNASGGLGKDIFALMQHNDRLWNTKFDAAYRSGSMVLKAMTGRALSEVPTTQIGDAIVVNPNYDVQQARFLGDVQTAMLVTKDADSMLSANTGIYRARPEQQTGNPRTAEEVRLQFQHSTILTNSGVNRYYDQADPWGSEMYRRAALDFPKGLKGSGIDLAREFQARCRDRGVPVASLRKVKRVRSMRTTGNGSIFMRQQAIQSLTPFAGSFPENGKQRFLEDTVAAFSSQAKVERYLPDPSIQEMPGRHQWDAQQENNDMSQGGPGLVTNEQNHTIHAQVHLAGAASALQSLQSGADPEKILVALESIGSHTAAHLNELAQDKIREQGTRLLTQQWQQLAKATDELRQVVEARRNQMAKQQQAAEQAQRIQTGMDPNTQIKAAEVAAKLQRDQAKTQQQMGLRQVKAEQDIAIKDAVAAADIRRKNAASRQRE